MVNAMSDDEFKTCFVRLKQLFPMARYSDAQVEAMHKEMVKFDIRDVLAGLNKLATTCPYNSPRLKYIFDSIRLVQTIHHTGGSNHKPSQSWQESFRQKWAHDDPQNASKYLAMTDSDVECHFADYQFMRSAEVYGPDSRSTVTAYWQYQHTLSRLERPDQKFVHSTAWSSEAEATYKVNGGWETAKQISDQYRGRDN